MVFTEAVNALLANGMGLETHNHPLAVETERVEADCALEVDQLLELLQK